MTCIGKIAKCREGKIGLVTCVFRVRDHSCYKGVCLDAGREGQVWQSIAPEWIGTLDDWVKIRHTEITQ